MKDKLLKFWKGAKAVVIPAVTVGATLAAQGYFGPKAAAVAVAVGTIWGVFSKRPQDPHTETEEKREALQALIRASARLPVVVPAARRDQ